MDGLWKVGLRVSRNVNYHKLSPADYASASVSTMSNSHCSVYPPAGYAGACRTNRGLCRDMHFPARNEKHSS